MSVTLIIDEINSNSAGPLPGAGTGFQLDTQDGGLPGRQRFSGNSDICAAATGSSIRDFNRGTTVVYEGNFAFSNHLRRYDA